MAKIGTKNGSNGRERDFVKRQERARARSASGKCHDATHRVERAKREECFGVPHANPRGLAKAPPERLSKHKGKVDDDRKTGMIKCSVNAPVEPNAC